MSRFLKSLHLFSLSFGFLSAAALIFNIVIFLPLYSRTTQFIELSPGLESLGIVAGYNILIFAIFQFGSVITLLLHLIFRKMTSFLKIAAITLGIISGLMILMDLAILSDIGKEYLLGWQTRGEWIILFISYGLHTITLILTLICLINNLKEDQKPAEHVTKDEVLFLSLHSTGVICGWLGLIGVFAALFSNLSAWMMEQIVCMLGLMILSPYLVILTVWIFRRRLANLSPGLDEKQFQDLSRAGLQTLLFSIPVMIGYFGLQISSIARDAWPLLWLPLTLFLILILFSSFTLNYHKR